LVHGFLIPETQKQVFRDKIKTKQQPFLQAAHQIIYSATSELIEEEKKGDKN